MPISMHWSRRSILTILAVATLATGKLQNVTGAATRKRAIRYEYFVEAGCILMSANSANPGSQYFSIPEEFKPPPDIDDVVKSTYLFMCEVFELSDSDIVEPKI